MANYHEMDRDALTAEKAALEEEYKQIGRASCRERV